MNSVQPAEDVDFDSEVPVLIVGAGAAGLCAALAASEAGIEPVVIERDAVPAGSTALSAGLIPAAGTRFQRERGIADSAALFAEDIARKAHGEADGKLVRAAASGAGPTVEWLADTYALPFEVITDFNYPGHSAHRMHGLPSRTGAELIDRLRSAVEARDIPILTGRVCETLFADEDGFIEGVEIAGGETIGCGALVLACNGYGGNAELVRRHIPEMGEALYFGHPGNQGDAVLWGEALGARLAALSGYQGHGSVATPHNILITWAAITEGGFQVNAQGRRFHNEALGYSEAAARSAAPAGRHCVRYFRCAHRGRGAAVRGFQERREGRRADHRWIDRRTGGTHCRAGRCARRGTHRDRCRARRAGSLRPRIRGGQAI